MRMVLGDKSVTCGNVAFSSSSIRQSPHVVATLPRLTLVKVSHIKGRFHGIEK